MPFREIRCQDKNRHKFPGAAKPQPKAIGNATEKKHTFHGKISSVVSVQNTVAKNLCFF